MVELKEGRSTLFFLVFLLSSTSLDAMIRRFDLSKNISDLPVDMINSIIDFSLPSLYFSGYKKASLLDKTDINQSKKILSLIAQEIIDLRFVNTQFNIRIVNNFAALLRLNQTDMDALLIRSVQENVPYFIKSAITHGANCNAVDELRGFTPLLYAAEGNNYAACSLLISKGADVNVKAQKPTSPHYSYHPDTNWPIHIAVKKGDAKMVALFVGKGADLNLRITNDPSITLLSSAVYRNDPEMLKVLLDSGAKDGYCNFGGKLGITAALKDANFGVSHKKKDDRNYIIKLLRHARKNLYQSKQVCGS